MRGENLFSAIGKADGKYTSGSDKKINSKGGSGAVLTVFKVIGAAASIVFVIGLAVTVWVTSVKNRDPISPAAAGTVTDTVPQTDNTAAVTEPKTERAEPSVTGPQTERSILITVDPLESTDDPERAVYNAMSEALRQYFTQPDLSRNYKRSIFLEVPVCDASFYGVGYEFPSGAAGVFNGYMIKAAAKRSGKNGFIYNESSKTDISRMLGGESSVWYAFISPENEEFTADKWSEQIGDYTFRYETSQKLTVIKDGKIIYGLKEAYDAGLVHEGELALAALCFDADHCEAAGAKDPDVYSFNVDGNDITDVISVNINREICCSHGTELSLTALVEALGGRQTVSYEDGCTVVRFDLPGVACTVNVTNHTIRSEIYKDPANDAKWFDSYSDTLYFDTDKGVVIEYGVMKTFIREFCSADVLVDDASKSITVITRKTGRYPAELRKALEAYFKAGASDSTTGSLHTVRTYTGGYAYSIFNGVFIQKAAYKIGNDGGLIYFVQPAEYRKDVSEIRVYGSTSISTNYSNCDIMVLKGGDLYYTLADAFDAGAVTEADIASAAKIFYGLFLRE